MILKNGWQGNMPHLLYKNAKVHYKDAGKGPVVVLLHGFLENLNMWADITQSLGKSHRVISLDLLGHGQTENIGYVHSMETQARMLKYLLDHLNISKCFLIGHSMGGYISLAFADLYPKMIKGLCLMNSTAEADSADKKLNRDRGIKAVKQNHRTFIRIAIPGLFSEANRSVFTDEIEQITKEALSMGQQGIIASLEGMKNRIDRSHLLDQNDFPVLMIIGQKDPALDYNRLIEQSKNAQVQAVVFEDGHMSHIENKEALIRAFKKFL
jgi:pimeloyl-ACP methyl ester carboxylesterase